jgi:Xaa-Pro aminopeptidase
MQGKMDPHLVSRVNQALSAYDLDALVASSFENVLYLSKTAILTQRLLRDRLAAVVWSARESPRLIVCSIEEAQAREESWISEIVPYTEFADSPVGPIAAALTDMLPRKARIGIEKHHLNAHHYDELVSLCPALTFVSADELLARLRMIKTPDEIAILEGAAQATDRVIRKAFESIRVGDTERKIAVEMEAELRSSGADSIEFIFLPTGSNARLAHPLPGDAQIEPGQIVRTDFGGRFGGYLSDIARTVVVHPASNEQRTTYSKLCEVHQHTIDALRPGVSASEIFHICARKAGQLGLDFTVPHIGHGLGIGLHEHPMLAPFEAEVLMPGMVLCIEPVARTDDGLFHTEDLVEITETGPRVLSRSTDWLALLEVG